MQEFAFDNKKYFLKSFLKSSFEFYCKNASAYAFVVKIKISIEEEYMAKNAFSKFKKRTGYLIFIGVLKSFSCFLQRFCLIIGYCPILKRQQMQGEQKGLASLNCHAPEG